jgi:DNA repair protein RadC
MCDLPTEEFWIVLLNQGAKVIDRVRISTGGISSTVVDVRCVLREALLHRAVCIAACHNHPSGQARPSADDDRLTERLYRAAKTMDIRLIDHVILTDGNYYSYADEGKLG